MKSEQRHKLQTNLLADRVGNAVEKARPFLGMALLGLLALVGLGIAGGVWYSYSQQKSAAAWKEFYFAGNDPDQLRQVYQDAASGSAAVWARQGEANSNLSNALKKVFIDRDEADDLLKQAKKGFEQVIQETNDPMLKCRATLGLAQTLETMSDIDAAQETYRKLLKMPKVDASLVKEVQSRLDWFESDEGKAFKDWFKDFKPATATPLDVNPNSGLPSTPDMTLPELEPVKPAETTEAPAKTEEPAKTETPAGTGTAAGTETPASAPQTETTPGQVETPTTVGDAPAQGGGTQPPASGEPAPGAGSTPGSGG